MMLQRIARAVGEWLDSRLGIAGLVGPMAAHRVPPNTGWWYVFGSATLTAFLVQAVTGVALATVYVASSGEAYATLQFITHELWFGRLLRGMHYFGASAMVLMAVVHAIRVFLFGSYKFPRELNWITGVLLLGLVLGMGFTGQILRWDQTAVWSLVVAGEQAGRAPMAGAWTSGIIFGDGNVGAATLSRFFVLHVFVLPGLLLGLVAAHLRLVLRIGISEPPVAGQPVDRKTYRQSYETLLEKTGVPFWPDAAWRDVAFGAGVVAVIVACAWALGPPELGKPPDPSLIEANPRPDWYLLWYFAVLALMPPDIENFVIVFAPLAIGLALLSLPFLFPEGERHPARRPQAVGAVIFILAGMGALWKAGVDSHWSPDFKAQPLPPQTVASDDPVVKRGAALFYDKGCLYCHRIQGDGGRRGPDLTNAGNRLTEDRITIRILNGTANMPAYGRTLKPDELQALVRFLESRTRPDHPPESSANAASASGR